MKSLIVYSSRTGNTKKVAEAINEVMPNATITPINSEAPDYKDFDIIAIGYWVDKGLPDAKVLDYFQTLQNTKIILFGTLGAYPHSDHAKDCIKKSEALLTESGRNNKVLGSFLCMGKVDPRILEMMAKMPQNPQHPMSEERKQRIEEAKKHPDDADLVNAQTFVKELLEKNL